jgi:glycosyltransferase involved in cell wall biosynthesis
MRPDIRPRHCMIVHAYYPLAETRVQREAETLVQAGFDVDVICLRDEGERARERWGGVEVHRLRVRVDKRGLAAQFLSYLRFFMLATCRLTRLHMRRPYRTVQVHNLPDFLVFCALVPKLQGVPVILDLHDLMPEFFAGRFGRERSVIASVIAWQERLACRFADHVITVSEHWRQALVDRGVPAARCSVVMNLADERIFHPLARSGRSRDGSDDAAFRLLYHGTVTHRYGLDLAVRAVARLRGEIPGIQLTILGRGDQMPELVDLVRELRLEGHVDLQDRLLPAEHLPEVIAAADLGIVPYRDDLFTDGLVPTKLLEYAAMALPCVAARTTAVQTTFGDSVAAYFAPGDLDDLVHAIRALWEQPAARERLESGSRRFTRRHNWAQEGRDYTALVTGLGDPGTHHGPGTELDIRTRSWRWPRYWRPADPWSAQPASRSRWPPGKGRS